MFRFIVKFIVKSHRAEDVLLAQFSLHVLIGGLKPHLFHFISLRSKSDVHNLATLVSNVGLRIEMVRWDHSRLG